MAVRDADHGIAAVELAGGLEQERDLLSAIEVNRARLRGLQAAAFSDRRVGLQVTVVDGHREYLRQQVDVHVDRARRQWPGPPTVAAARAVDVGDHHRLAALRCGGDLGRLAHLVLAVAVDLGDSDLSAAH